MFVKLLLSCSIFGLLAACTAPAPVEMATPSPSTIVENSPTAENIASQETNSSSMGFDCGNTQEIPLEECQALVTLYESTQGDSWLDHSGWLVDPSPCNWYGVICQQGHVRELQLYYNGLTGSLPGAIGNLIHLKNLYLDRDQLSGPVPPEIGNLKELEVARLGGNQFSSIPVELANLNRLMYLELWGNQLSGEIPPEVGNLSLLVELRLQSNKFTGNIPPELGKLTNLTHLDLSRNQLDGPIPAELGNLVILNELSLSSNQLSGPIPAELGNLKGLYYLDLSYNQLSGQVPASIASAPIGDLRLWGNLLDGTIPSSAEKMTRVDSEGINFEFRSALAESVWPEAVVAQPPSDQIPDWEVRPEHLRFTFASRTAPFHSNGIGASGHPQIIIYPAKEYRGMSDLAKTEIDALHSLMKQRSVIPDAQLPFLPLINAAQVFHAQEKYVDFQNGSGVRFITQYSQDVVGRLTNKDIFYTFQGLTQDGKYYVSVVFPISAEGLGNEPVNEDWEAAQAHQKEDIQHLKSLSPSQFEPDLQSLDTMIQSLKVNAP